MSRLPAFNPLVVLLLCLPAVAQARKATAATRVDALLQSLRDPESREAAAAELESLCTDDPAGLSALRRQRTAIIESTLITRIDAILRRAGIPRTITHLADARIAREIITQGEVLHVEFSPESGKILIASKGGVTIWDRRTGEISDRKCWVASACFAPNGADVVIATHEEVQICDATLQRVSRSIQAPRAGSFVFARHTPDARFLLLVSKQNMVPGSGQWSILDERVFAKRTLVKGEVLSPFYSLLGSGKPDHEKLPITTTHVNDRWGIAFATMSRRGEYLALRSGSGTTKIYRARTGDQVASLHYYYREADENGTRGGWSINTLAFSRDERFLYMAGSRGFIRAWDIDESKEIIRWRAASETGIESITLGPDPKTLFATDSNGRIRMWDVSGDGAARELDLRGPQRGRIIFSNDPRVFATIGKAKVTVWKASD